MSTTPGQEELGCLSLENWTRQVIPKRR